MAMTYAARSCRVSINLTYRFDSFGSFEMERARLSRLDDDFDENYDRLPARDDQSNPGFSCTFHAEELKRGNQDRILVNISRPLCGKYKINLRIINPRTIARRFLCLLETFKFEVNSSCYL